MNKKELIKQIAHSMIQHQLSSNLGKKEAHESFKARSSKKKIPDVKGRAERKPDEGFRKMTMSEYKKKYGDSVFGKYM